MTTEIYIHRRGQKLGPFTLKDLESGVAQGTFSYTDDAWHEGLDSWKPLAELLPAPTSTALSLVLPQPPPLRQLTDEEILRPPLVGSCLMAGIGLFFLFTIFAGLIMGKWFLVLMPLSPACFFLGKYGLRLLPNASFLKLSPEGMLVRDFYNTSFFRWDEIDKFELRDEKRAAIDQCPELQKTRIIVHSGGAEGIKPREVQLPVLDMKPQELVQMLEARVQAHLASAKGGIFNPSPLPTIHEPTPQSQRAFEIAGYTSVILALFACPPVFGVLGFLLGMHLERKWHSQHAKPIKSMSIAFAIAGILIGTAVSFLLTMKSEKANSDAMMRGPYSPERLREWRNQ